MKLKSILILSAAMSALTFSACSGAKQATVANTSNTANTANKSNTAVVTNANTAPANTAANTTAASSAATYDGDVLKIDEAGVMMNVPKGMKFSKDGQDTIVKTDDDGVDTRFTLLSDENMDKVIEDAYKEIDEYITDSKLNSEEPKKTMQNGLEVSSWEGTGKASNGEAVQFQLAIVSIPDSPKKPLLALTYAEAGSMKSHQADLAKFFQSIRKQ